MSRRLFVAITFPEHVEDELFGLMFDGLPNARWSDETQLHLTLRFLGDVDGALERDVVTALSRVHADAFELQLSGVGYFPPRGPIRTLWAGVAPSPELDGLRKWVDGQMTRLGVTPDRRRFSPHVTLARLDDPPAARVARYLTDHALFKSPTFEVDAIHLIASRLLDSGPAYTHVASFPLRGGAGWTEDGDDPDDAAGHP